MWYIEKYYSSNFMTARYNSDVKISLHWVVPSQKYGTDLAQAIKFRNATGSWTFLDIANPVPLTLGKGFGPILKCSWFSSRPDTCYWTCKLDNETKLIGPVILLIWVLCNFSLVTCIFLAIAWVNATRKIQTRLKVSDLSEPIETVSTLAYNPKLSFRNSI